MMQPIDKQTHMVVDLCDYSEIKDVESADPETNQIVVRENTYAGEVRKTVHLPLGFKILRRR
ncbi:MAG: hypothetical protein AB7H90_01145 [Alphaproteobacteria bacterium]